MSVLDPLMFLLAVQGQRRRKQELINQQMEAEMLGRGYQRVPPPEAPPTEAPSLPARIGGVLESIISPGQPIPTSEFRAIKKPEIFKAGPGEKVYAYDETRGVKEIASAPAKLDWEFKSQVSRDAQGNEIEKMYAVAVDPSTGQPIQREVNQVQRLHKPDENYGPIQTDAQGNMYQYETKTGKVNWLRSAPTDTETSPYAATQIDPLTGEIIYLTKGGEAGTVPYEKPGTINYRKAEQLIELMGKAAAAEEAFQSDPAKKGMALFQKRALENFMRTIDPAGKEALIQEIDGIVAEIGGDSPMAKMWIGVKEGMRAMHAIGTQPISPWTYEP